MTPIICDGDIVTIERLGGMNPTPGDTAAFTEPLSGKLFIHRIIARNHAVYLFKGDNRRDTDGWIPASRIIGRVTTVERNEREMRLGIGLGKNLATLLNRLNAWPMLILPIYRRTRSLFKGLSQ